MIFSFVLLGGSDAHDTARVLVHGIKLGCRQSKRAGLRRGFINLACKTGGERAGGGKTARIRNIGLAGDSSRDAQRGVGRTVTSEVGGMIH